MKNNTLKRLSIGDKKTKIHDLSVKEIISLKDNLSFDRYCIYVDNYLFSRIRNNVFCSQEEIEDLKTLYRLFSNDEKTSLKYLNKLYNYIDELKYISKNNYGRKVKRNDVNDISIKKLISLKDEYRKEKYIGFVKKYLYVRISKRNYCNDKEIEELKALAECINTHEEIEEDKKHEICQLLTKLIVFSKNKDKKNYLKRLSKLNALSLEELYLYLETVIKYAYFCIDEKSIDNIIMLFKNDIDYLNKIEELLYDNYIISESYDLINKLKEELEKKNKFKNDFPNISIKYKYLDHKLPFIEDKNVITIDEAYSPDLDGAFSIEKKDNMYVLEVYVTDVPSFLLKNEELMKIAYDRATSMYNSQNSNRLIIRDMLPQEISHDYFSLKKNGIKNVITFTYYIDFTGNVVLQNISRNAVFINDNIRPKRAESILLSPSKYSRTDKDLKLYKEACELISKNSKERFLNELNPDKIESIIGVPSILTNYHIGKNSDFAIYREQGKYTKESKEKYTHSSTPLRKFVSNINLAFYLNQIGIIDCPDKYIYYVEDHLDEIIDHINKQEEVKEEFQKKYKMIKKYYDK